ncbi:hypothetical protein AB4K20DRAFT_1883029 [Rhizopus microsporus]
MIHCHVLLIGWIICFTTFDANVLSMNDIPFNLLHIDSRSTILNGYRCYLPLGCHSTHYSPLSVKLSVYFQLY